MKKSLLFALCALLLPIVANAYNFSVDGIYYNKNSDGTSVTITYKTTSYNSYSGSVTIPSQVTYSGKTYSVTSIGQNAFSGCSGLKSVTIPNSVTSIGKEAFFGCSGLTSLKVEEGNPKYDSRNNCNAIIESSTNTLIAGCNTTTIPNSVTSIGYDAFYGCSGLTSVTIPNSVTSIGQNAFYNCSGLTSVTIGNSVTYIGSSAFSGCTGLTSITIPNSVTSIGNSAFNGCSGLTSVTIPNSVTSIGEGAFYKCSGLTSVTIPNSVTSIRNYAFRNCSGLTSVTISNSVTSIGEYAFAYCTRLTSVTCQAKNVPTTRGECFYNVRRKTATLYVPEESVNAYKSAYQWKDFGTILPIPILGDANGNGVVEIGDVTSVLTLMATPEAIGYDNKAADANGNGEIEIGDVTTILTIMANGE